MQRNFLDFSASNPGCHLDASTEKSIQQASSHEKRDRCRTKHREGPGHHDSRRNHSPGAQKAKIWPEG
jgi:hypothetical protein